jgi:DNA-binding NarL/FixJ family response regulator
MCRLARASLEQERLEFELIHVATRTDFFSALEKESIDLILADYSLPSFNGIAALQGARERYPDLPFILLSGTIGEEIAVEALKNGATDYVLKQRISRLPFSIRRAIREGEEERAHKFAQEALHERLNFEELIANLSTEFISASAEEIDHQIERALRVIGEFTQADRCRVVQFSITAGNVERVYEWCEKGIPSQSSIAPVMNFESFRWSMERLMSLEPVYVPDMQTLPPEATVPEREFLSRLGIRSMIAIPLAYEGSLRGTLRMDYVRGKKSWPEDMIAPLKIVGEIFVNAFRAERGHDAGGSAPPVAEDGIHWTPGCRSCA